MIFNGEYTVLLLRDLRYKAKAPNDNLINKSKVCSPQIHSLIRLWYIRKSNFLHYFDWIYSVSNVTNTLRLILEANVLDLFKRIGYLKKQADVERNVRKMFKLEVYGFQKNILLNRLKSAIIEHHIASIFKSSFGEWLCTKIL